MQWTIINYVFLLPSSILVVSFRCFINFSLKLNMLITLLCIYNLITFLLLSIRLIIMWFYLLVIVPLPLRFIADISIAYSHLQLRNEKLNYDNHYLYYKYWLWQHIMYLTTSYLDLSNKCYRIRKIAWMRIGKK